LVYVIGLWQFATAAKKLTAEKNENFIDRAYLYS